MEGMNAIARLGRLAYRVDATAEGGMGRVYLLSRDPALPPVSHRQLAVKTFKPNFPEGAVRNELRRWLVLEHPHILPLLDISHLDWCIAAVMPRMKGTLADIIQTCSIPERDVRQLLRSVLDGLGYAARRGLFHLDVKPLNLLYDDSPLDVQISDWGLALLTEPSPDGTPSLAYARGARGTPIYSAPELLNPSGWKVDARADIYSLGVTGLELAVGPLSTVGLRYDRPLQPQLASIASRVQDRRLRQFIQAALDLDPGQRPPNFRTAADMLKGGILEFFFGWRPGQAD